MGRAIVTFILGLVFVGVLVGIGAEIYQSGVAQGVIDAGRFPAGAPVPVAGYGGYGGSHGFNFLGLLFPILFLFLIFGLIRAAFSRGRGWGHSYGHGYGREYGWGPGWDKGEGAGDGGPRGPEGWREERDRRMAELHRRLHEADGGTDAASGAPKGT
jgi:hypothetical protein